MSIEVGYPHIEKPGNGPARLRNTPRVRVAQVVMDYLNYGWSVDEMCRQHLYLTVVFTQDIGFRALAEQWQGSARPFAGLILGRQLGSTIGEFVSDLELIGPVLLGGTAP